MTWRRVAASGEEGGGGAGGGGGGARAAAPIAIEVHARCVLRPGAVDVALNALRRRIRTFAADGSRAEVRCWRNS